MRGLTKILAGAVLAAGVAGGAQATSIGGTVSNSDFNAALGAGAVASGLWSYVGGTTAAFTLPGNGALTLRSASYGDSFGYSTTSYGSQTVVFGSGASVGSTASITPGFSPFLFYFANNQSAPDTASLWTDGHETGSTYKSQADMDIFYNATSKTYAFFFDDGGPSGSGDDNDYNDMVVTYTPATTPVPEPATIALFGAGLVGLGAAVRRRRKA